MQLRIYPENLEKERGKPFPHGVKNPWG